MATLKQSTGYTRTFLMVQTSDHISGITGATVAVKLSKAGATGASAGGTVTEVDSTNNPGLYKIVLTTTDTNTVGDLSFHCTATSADPTDFIDQVSATIIGDTLPANVLQWNTTNVASPATAGIPEVNVKNINNVATTSVTTVTANQGTTQPINFTGTAGSALVKSDAVDIAGSAVSATTAQLGVNVVNWNNTVVATPATAGIPDINLKNIANAAVSATTAQLGVNLVNIAGSAVSTATAQIGTNVVSVAGGASNIKKNQALAKFEFLMTDSTTHAPKTGVTVTATRSLDGGAFASCANSVTELASGIYYIDLATTDLNANVVTLRFTGTASDDRLITIVTQP